jgi:predicted DNA-binding protein (UPF0251 family)
MLVNGFIKSIEIWIPLDAKNKNSRVLTLSLNSTIKMKQNSEIIVQTSNLTGMVTRNEITKQLTDTKILVNDLEIVMHNRHIKNLDDEELEESLLMPSSITLIHDQLVYPPEEYDVTNISVQIDPLELRVGFREIDNFKDIGKVLQDITSKLDGGDDDPSNMTFEELEAKRASQEDRIQQKETALKEETQRYKVKKFQNRKKKEVKLMNAKISLSLLSLSLMDDTAKHEYPILNISINNSVVKFSQEEGQDDAVAFILKKMSIYKYPILKVEARLHLSSSYFNMENGYYEPLIEPWSLSATVKQKDTSSSKIINVISKKMLNINLTFGMTSAIKRVLDAIEEDKKDWQNEQLLNDLSNSYIDYSDDSDNSPKKLVMDKNKGKLASYRKPTDRREHAKLRTVNYTDVETDGYRFENNIDVPMVATLENYVDSINIFGNQMTEKQRSRALD